MIKKNEKKIFKIQKRRKSHTLILFNFNLIFYVNTWLQQTGESDHCTKSSPANSFYIHFWVQSIQQKVTITALWPPVEYFVGPSFSAKTTVTHRGTDSMWTLNPTIDRLVCPPTHAQLGSDLGILEAKPTPRTYVVKPFLSHFALPSLHMCTYEPWLPITLLLIHYLRFLDHFWKIVYTADLKPCFDPIV